MSEIVEKFDLEETKEIPNVDDGAGGNDNNGIDAGTNTSPGQLQDVTMDNSYTIGYRSPCHSLQHGSNGSGCGGNTSPGQGRSVREFEEQMTALRKENFNLKLRIYFLEEKIPGYSSSSQNHQDGHETLIKQNVDLKVDIEVLRKELQEKQKLLCEAAKAMDLMEQQQKATEEQSQTIIDELNEKIRYLESENRELEKLPIGQHTLDQLMGRTELGNDIDTVQKIRELEGFIKQYEQKTDELTDKINELETNLNNKNDNINLLEKKIKQLEYHNSELQEQLDIKMKDNLNAETIIKELERKLNQNDNTEQQQQQLLAEDYEKLKNFYDQEKLNTEKIMEEMRNIIEHKSRNETNLSKALEDYERVLFEFKNDKRRLYKENIRMRNILYNFDKSLIMNNNCSCNGGMKIHLGSSISSTSTSSLSTAVFGSGGGVNCGVAGNYLSSFRSSNQNKHNHSISFPIDRENYYSNEQNMNYHHHHHHHRNSKSTSSKNNHRHNQMISHIESNPFLVNPLFLSPNISRGGTDIYNSKINNGNCKNYQSSTEYKLKHEFSLSVNRSAEISEASATSSLINDQMQGPNIRGLDPRFYHRNCCYPDNCGSQMNLTNYSPSMMMMNGNEIPRPRPYNNHHEHQHNSCCKKRLFDDTRNNPSAYQNQKNDSNDCIGNSNAKDRIGGSCDGNKISDFNINIGQDLENYKNFSSRRHHNHNNYSTRATPNSDIIATSKTNNRGSIRSLRTTSTESLVSCSSHFTMHSANTVAEAAAVTTIAAATATATVSSAMSVGGNRNVAAAMSVAAIETPRTFYHPYNDFDDYVNNETRELNFNEDYLENYNATVNDVKNSHRNCHRCGRDDGFCCCSNDNFCDKIKTKKLHKKMKATTSATTTTAADSGGTVRKNCSKATAATATAATTATTATRSLNIISKNKNNKNNSKKTNNSRNRNSKNDSGNKHQKLKEELIDYKKQLADKICTLEEVDTKLQQKTKEHEKACNAIQKLLKNTRDLQGEIEKLRKLDLSDQHHVSQIKEERSSDVAASIRQSFSDLTVGTIDDWNAYKTKFEKLLEDKDAEIQKLKLEIKKKTANLQNLVNKELWEKNREIERLTKLLNKAQSHPVSVPNSPTREIDQLQQSFTDSDYTAAIERNKCLQKKVDTLVQRLCAVAEQNPEPLVQQLRMELQEAREETEKANQWRKECTDVCEMLKDRLEELAGFLDSLLEDDTLRALAADKRRAMKKAINRSLEMSRSLNNMSLSRSRLSVSGIGEQSLIQLSSISGFLDLENKENRTFNLHENQNQDLVIIENLKAEIKSLKKELDRKKSIDSGRKERRSLPVSLPIENQSESEAWSEPDRKVSLARIGLEERLLVKSSVSNIKEEQHESTTESGEIDPSRKSKWYKAQKKIAMLEQMISDRDNRILEVQCELVEADNRLKEENLRLIEVNRELEEYKNVNEMLEIEIANFKSQEGYYQEMKYKFEPMKQELEEKERQLETIQNERDNLNIAICKNEMEIKTLKSDIENLKSKYEKRLESAIEQEKQKLMKMQAELNSEWEEKMKQQEDKFRSNLARDWVSRSLYTDLKHELEGVQKRLCEAQNTIEFLQENESELNKQLIDNEKGVRNLKKKLDEATLQASKAALERTKAMNDKLMLESKLNELIKRMEKVEIEKHELTTKLTQVEKSNSLLHKKLTNYIDMTTVNNVSTNANVTTNHTKTRKQSSTGGGSEASQSGYTSEDVPMIHNRHNNNAITTVNNNDGNDNRSLHRHENSSPDLGIESDVGGGSGTGRTSSVDMMSGQRSVIGLLKPINVLSSDEHNNDLDKETLPESSDCDAFVNDTVNNNTNTTNTTTTTTNNNSNHNNTTALVTTTASVTEMARTVIHDCVKVEKENEELRRKLKRTKMAFEDTCNKLRSANQRKEQIERDLRQQIEKTQKVLKNVRTNLENELEQQPKKK